MGKTEFNELLHRYNANQCTEDEKALIESWYLKLEAPDVPDLTAAQIAEIMNLQPPVTKLPNHRLRNWISAAAAVLVLSTAALIFWQQKPNTPTADLAMQHDARPGSDKATLTLASGQKIQLDNKRPGQITIQNNTQVIKTADGSIQYHAEDADGEMLAQKNTIATPNGGQYHLTLSDGTNVWLNAASSITYPVYFSKTERNVEITGEVYFEVSHRNNQPFKVHTDQQVVEVLGTHFNVNSYSDEPQSRVTLLEGSVKVNIPGKSEIIKPGQQAIISAGNINTIIADIEQTMAWHEGDFVFSNKPLKNIMRELSRWYDVEVNYDDYKDKKYTFSGVVSRSRNLSAVLKMMENTKSLKFRINGKHLYVIN